ncbi:TPA: pilus assembly protein N-terminal domain-containing protein [Vibrio parahaemolyticus]|uniref:type II and III secretion system protein family protein n=1 Tax=Vibrio TaxID=662 RepID=UPI00146BF537|nr:pilus assembly protein N-terminal domain-containing protein [Vibrio parahaemolyticus]MDF5020785.1 pilus assembly protein N-terminal domain-containing protein [Vibrio parahaemolyticus]MDF5040120.1 pilus assembly protein N-terminal domain-containing protein [Vibrio parahaemolyticus]MDF5046224.1 pilus assembly protein N-terminal domain-containing protein [Vibrio parahaemolyticus]MDF5090326.1 pilus assembly protein N-terminal domain-containing protein [Vibrio parahaemolyticus]MDF5135039.1 pilus
MVGIIRNTWQFGLSALLCVLFSASLCAAEQYITVGDGQHIAVEEAISTIFISDPEVVDYNVVNENTVVVFAKSVGQARLIVYGNSEKVLLSQRIIVDVDLSLVRRQIKLMYPDLNVKVESVGQQVAVSGIVDSEQQRDDIYRMVATLLGRKKVEKWEDTDIIEFKGDGFDVQEPQSMIFARNMTWEGILELLEVATDQQVNVKISVAQVTESFAKTVGVDWSSVGADVGEFLFQQFDAADLTTLITALGNENVAQILAEPNLTVISGESASFLVGGEVPIVVSTNSNINITFREFGIKLDLTAKVLHEDKIRMRLIPEVSEVERYIRAAGIEVPQFATRRAMTTIELGDGDSFVLGGLMSSADLEELQKTPLLGDVPILGAAFRKASTDRRHTELIIVATVNLVKPIKNKEIQLPYIRKTSTLHRWFNVDTNDVGNKGNDPTIKLLSQGGFIQ